MIQVICPECKGKGKVPCPICKGKEQEIMCNCRDKEDCKDVVDCIGDKESQEQEILCNCRDKEDSKELVDCRGDKESKEKECEVCGGKGEVLCTACMGGGIMDTSAFA